MNQIIQPLSEHFLYCSPEAMSRDLYRRRTLTEANKKNQQKKKAGVDHGTTKTD
ncbi:MAG: hypothetical protein OQL20_03355 [Sedimenticola sp.]|nr:hypothetical protein [Sedimenticola sp.]